MSETGSVVTDGGPTPDDAVLRRLESADLTVLGRIADASNGALLVQVGDGASLLAVYKPARGERPLWDFPRGSLCRREVASFELSRITGLHVVPETVLREDPAGIGSVQRWVGPTPEDDGSVLRDVVGGIVVDVVRPRQVPDGWLTVFDGEDLGGRSVVLCHDPGPQLRRIAFFDVLANNADRKGGHVLRDLNGALYGIDHGLTFHDEHKLRTVLWGWAGEPLLPSEQTVLETLRNRMDDAREQLTPLLSQVELDALAARVQDLLVDRRLPRPGYHSHPIPWPVF